jgi:hypothetical protein
MATNAVVDELLHHHADRDAYRREWGFAFPDDVAEALARHADQSAG